MSVHRPKKAPPRRVYHRSWVFGFFVNSIYGTLRAVAKGFGWIDNDHHLSSDGKWVNAHGAPERFWRLRRKFEFYPWERLKGLSRKRGRRTYELRSGGQTLRDNAANGLRTEFEVKDTHPVSREIRQAAFGRLAAAANDAYGDDWQNRVVVKVLSNLGGGEEYAVNVLKDAHDAGFKTMLLARGHSTRKTFAGYESITYVRGSAVIR